MKPEDSITITADTIDLSNIEIDHNALTGGYNNAITGGYNGITYTDFSPKAGIQIKEGNLEIADGYDIKIGGRSMLATLDTIAQRLAMLETNKELEQEFEELRALGDQYRKLEAELKQRMATWDLLKAET